MPSAARSKTLEVAGRTVTVTNPDKVYFPVPGHTKLDLVRYYVAVAEGALRGIRGRPIVLKRYVDGADQPAFYQKRAPTSRPPWIETTTLRFPSGRSAEEIVVRDAAQLVWIVNLGCIDLHPHPVRAADLDHPDELRVDLDPVPGVGWDDVRRVAVLCREVLAEHGLTAWPKTSGSRGMHLCVRIAPRWSFDEVRRAALALAREVERRAPARATSKWWKEERHGVFIDYNQNAKDRTTASAYSVRPTPDARVSTPLAWDEVPECDPAAFTLTTVPARFAAIGDPAAGIDDAAGALDGLLELAERQAAAGLADAPWPPHFAKAADEPTRVAPSRRARARAARTSGTRATEAAAQQRAIPGAAAAARAPQPRRRRATEADLVTVAQASRREDALAGLGRWKRRHPSVAARLAESDVLVDTMRGRSSTWTRIRVNLRAVPAAERPPAEPPDPDFDPRRAP
jgi:DNA ligase D-like protein (predicted polymerase)